MRISHTVHYNVFVGQKSASAARARQQYPIPGQQKAADARSPNVTERPTIRRYEPGDEDRIAEVVKTAHREADAWVGDADEDLDEDLDEIDDVYFPDGEFLVAELGGRIVGSIAFRPPGDLLAAFYDEFGDGAAQIKRFSVAPDYQRRGVGRALYDELERRARERGRGEFVLLTTDRQDAARQFYEAVGFEQVVCERVDDFETPFDLLVYRTSLTESA